MKSFLPSAVFQSAGRAELNGRGPVAKALPVALARRACLTSLLVDIMDTWPN